MDVYGNTNEKNVWTMVKPEVEKPHKVPQRSTRWPPILSDFPGVAAINSACFGKWLRFDDTSFMTHMLHVWYICPHLVGFREYMLPYVAMVDISPYMEHLGDQFMTQ